MDKIVVNVKITWREFLKKLRFGDNLGCQKYNQSNNNLISIFFIWAMTDLIDLNYGQRNSCSGYSQDSETETFLQQSTKIYCIQQIIPKFVNKIEKSEIKTFQIYVFEVDPARILLQEVSYYHPVKIVGVISLGGGIFSMRIQFYDQRGFKITGKSTYHRTIIANFFFQINSQLQNFKLQYNPVSGQFSFLFDVKVQFIDRSLIIQLIEFALDCYIEECQAHFYVLHLIQYVDQHKNQYLKNVLEEFTLLKRWILERRQQNSLIIEKFDFYEKLQEAYIRTLETYKFASYQKRSVFQIKLIKRYLHPQNQNLEYNEELSAGRIKKVWKRFNKYYRQEQIIRNYLVNKTKYQNLVKINPKQTEYLEKFLIGNKMKNLNERMILYDNILSESSKSVHKRSTQMQDENIQDQSLSSQQNLCLWDKETGKNYNLKLIYLKSSAKRQSFIAQKLCKLQSYSFINQYFQLENQVSQQNHFALVNAHPRRVVLKDFLKKNKTILSLSSRLKLCVNLVEIVYTLQIKSKIQNYLPLISIKNLQISRNLSLSFHILSYFSKHSLFQLMNAICMIVFQTPLHLIDRENLLKKELVKGDQVQNKQWGMSFCIYSLKFYMTEMYNEFLKMIWLEQIKSNKKFTQIQNFQFETYKKERLSRTCQQLLVILKHYESFTSRGFDQKYNFEDQSDSED